MNHRLLVQQAIDQGGLDGGVQALPFITLAVTLATTATSTAVQAVGQQQAGDYQATVDENNAKLARQQAADAQQRGAEAAREAEIEGRRAANEARAQTAGAGLDYTTGSVAAGISGIEAGAAVDAERLRRNAVLQKWGLQNQAQDMESTAKQRRRASALGSVGQGLAGVGQMAGQVGGFAASRGY